MACAVVSNDERSSICSSMPFACGASRAMRACASRVSTRACAVLETRHWNERGRHSTQSSSPMTLPGPACTMRTLPFELRWENVGAPSVTATGRRPARAEAGVGGVGGCAVAVGLPHGSGRTLHGTVAVERVAL
jgi:hypothetical protein